MCEPQHHPQWCSGPPLLQQLHSIVPGGGARREGKVSAGEGALPEPHVGFINIDVAF